MTKSRILGLKTISKLNDFKGTLLSVKDLIVSGDISLINHLKQIDVSTSLLIGSDYKSLNQLIDEWTFQYTFFRGSGLGDLDESLNSFEEEPLFYKDQNLRSFNGRAKSHKLLPFEDYFKARTLVNEFKVDEAICEKFDKIKKVSADILKIEKTEDLWKILCSDGSVIECKNIYWGKSRKNFFDLCSDEYKGKFTENELKCFAHQSYTSILNFSFELETIIQEKSRTVFIPQSQTHEWGHFIFDFHTPANGRQKVSSHTFIRDANEDEEALGKRVRTLKRNFLRVFPEAENMISKEKISFLNNFWVQSEKFDSLEWKDSSKFPHFCGPAAFVNQEQFEKHPFPFLFGLIN